jgi:integrase
MPDPTRLPKYRHYKPKDLAVVRIDVRDIYLGKYDSPESRERYGCVLAEWMSSGIITPSSARLDSDVADIDGPTVSAIITALWRHADTYYRRADGTPTGEAKIFRRTLRPLRQLYGSTLARDFGPKSLIAVRQTMIDAGLCRKTINQRIRRIVHVFGWADECELVHGTVHHAQKAVRGLQRGRSKAGEGDPVKPVPDSLVEAIRPHVPRQILAMIELQRLTGMRPGEVTSMRTCDLDRTGKVWTFIPGTARPRITGMRGSSISVRRPRKSSGRGSGLTRPPSCSVHAM